MKSLIEFVGSPGSGKTTIAALVFAALKEQGIVAEFICEEARRYIAETKYTFIKKTITLKDEDQLAIMDRQIHSELAMYYSLDEGVVVTDSSPLNALLYMKEPLGDQGDQYLRKFLVSQPITTFWCHSTNDHLEIDSNRIHSADQIQAVNAKVPLILQQYGVKTYPLTGSIQHRKGMVLRHILDSL